MLRLSTPNPTFVSLTPEVLHSVQVTVTVTR